jgi:hypothetical protein
MSCSLHVAGARSSVRYTGLRKSTGKTSVPPARVVALLAATFLLTSAFAATKADLEKAMS